MGKARKKHTTPKHSSRGSVARLSAIVIPINIILIIGYLVVVKAQGSSTFVDESVLYGTILILMVLMVIIIPTGGGHEGGASRKHKKRHRAPPKSSAPGKPKQKKKPVIVKAAVIEERTSELEKGKERKVISYPEAVSGGKYGDAYIPISSDMILKVRTLLARSCKMCKNRDICWEKYKDTMDYETFLESTECFEEMAEDALPAPVGGVSVEPVVEEPVVVEEGESFEEAAVERQMEGTEVSEEEVVWE